MNAKDKRKVEYAADLESQFILRLPEEPAKELRELLKSGENIKNRLTIKIEDDMRHGEVRFDHWLMHAKIVDLPTISESLKTIDNKSFYKTADVCQMMICKEEPDPTPSEEESPTKNKKKDPSKVDKKFLFPHGITPPTKNVRKRRFRKTLKKKCVEAPEIEKEVKRLLRADNAAESTTYEIIREDDEQLKPEPIPSTSTTTTSASAATSTTTSYAITSSAATTTRKPEKKQKAECGSKKESVTSALTSNQASNVVDIFGGAVSDSDVEDHHDHNVKESNITLGLQDCHLSAPDSKVVKVGKLQKKDTVAAVGKMQKKDTVAAVGKMQKKDTVAAVGKMQKKDTVAAIGKMQKKDTAEFETQKKRAHSSKSKKSNKIPGASPAPVTSTVTKSSVFSSEQNTEYQSQDLSKDDLKIEQLRTELEELKQRRQRTKNEIAGMENLALRQRFEDILHTLNQDVMYKEMEYQGLITLQNSEDI